MTWEFVSQFPFPSATSMVMARELMDGHKEREPDEGDESARLAVEEERQRDVAQAEKEEESRRVAEEQRREEASALQSVVLLPGGISCLFLVHSG